MQYAEHLEETIYNSTACSNLDNKSWTLKRFQHFLIKWETLKK